MKVMKKIATLVLAICLAVPCFSMISHAVTRIEFEDPSTAVGEVVQFKCVIKSETTIEDRTIVMTYDTSMLKFKSGDNITETEAGTLTYSVKDQQGNQRVEIPMSFDVLKEGTTQVKIASYEIYSASGTKLTYTQGFSTITIAAGDPSTVPTEEPAENTGAIVKIDGEEYVLSESFAESDIPEGYAESTLEYAGTEYKVVVQESTGLCLAYLVNGASEGEFFLYVEEDATFAPFKQISISDSTTIVLLSYVEDIVFPEPYIETTVDVNEYSFPAWQSTENTDVCVIYAMNSRGEKSLYQFDTVEGTYQRFEMPVVEEEEEDTSFIGKLSTILGEHMDLVVLGVGVGLILFLIVVIVLSVKLYNRNAELDELYEEYGIDLFDNEPEQKDNSVIRIDDESDSEEIDYEKVDYETEDDIVIAGLDEIEEESIENDTEVEEEPVEEEIEASEVLEPRKAIEDTADMKEAIKTVAEAVKSDEDYWNDNEDADFEIDFIDLDD